MPKNYWPEINSCDTLSEINRIIKELHEDSSVYGDEYDEYMEALSSTSRELYRRYNK